MMKSTLALKATVTKRPTADPVDQVERLLQAEHHEAAENAAVTATEPATAEQTEQVVSKPHALQSAFLSGNLGKLVTIFTINGIKLVGKLRQFDQFTLLLEGPDRIRSLIFKHAVSTIASTNDRYE